MAGAGQGAPWTRFSMPVSLPLSYGLNSLATLTTCRGLMPSWRWYFNWQDRSGSAGVRLVVISKVGGSRPEGAA